MDIQEGCELSLARLISDAFTIGGDEISRARDAARPCANVFADKRRRRAERDDKENASPYAKSRKTLECDSLHDMEEELDTPRASVRSKYEIISTDSPDVETLLVADLEFGSPIDSFGASERSTTFPLRRPPPPRTDTTRMLDFDEHFASPPMPSSFGALITANIESTPPPPAPRHFGRCISVQDRGVRTALFKEPARRKRADADRDDHLDPKRRRAHLSDNAIAPSLPSLPPVPLQRSMSDNEASIKAALARAHGEPDLIGDFSKPYCLPLESSQQQDLKAISQETMAALLDGEYARDVERFQVIDCRYPYEFDGGHIVGATNLFTEEMVRERLLRDPRPRTEAEGRSVLVFHCEFSFERGPRLCRFLRRADRALNRDSYPGLRHPEVYVLRGGYRGFHARYKHHCYGGYTPMSDPDHVDELRTHRANASSRRPLH